VSLLWWLRKYVDSIQFREEQEERRRKREAIPPEFWPDDGDVVVPPPREETLLYRCRVCGHEGFDRSYCPKCLADTMLRV
jgi:hypothetical protein